MPSRVISNANVPLSKKSTVRSQMHDSVVKKNTVPHYKEKDGEKYPKVSQEGGTRWFPKCPN